MALGTPIAAAASYSANNGNSVSPAYPSGILATDVVVLFVGQKPSTANSGTVTTPTGWTLRDSLTAAGGYGATLGADTGNTNLFVYTWDNPVAGQTGNLTVTIGTNNISWAFIVRIPTGGNVEVFGSADGSRTTAPTSGTPYTVALTNGTPATNLKAGDLAIWAMCIPTDVLGGAGFSAHTISATGTTFGTVSELNEPSSGTGNDIGGYSAWVAATAGSSTVAPTIGATATGTVTNVRGPIVLIRIRELPFINAEAGSFTYTGQTITETVDRNLNAEDAAFTYTGQDATLEIDRTFNAEAGSFTYTGQNTTETIARSVNAEAGSFNYTGEDATLNRSYSFNAEAGSFSYTGQDATFERDVAFNAEAGSFAYTGENANLSRSLVVNAEVGTFTYTGEDATFAVVTGFDAESGSFTYTGQDATLDRSYSFNAEAGAFTYTGENAELILVQAQALDAQVGTFDYTGEDATLNRTYLFDAEVGVFTYTGEQAYFESTFTAEAGSFDYTGQDATLSLSLSFNAEAGTFDYTGENATLLTERAVDAEAGAFTYTGQNATFEAESAFDAGSFAYTGQDATFTRSNSFNAGQGAFGEADPYVDQGYVNPGYVTGLTATLLLNKFFSAQAGIFTYTGRPTTLRIGTLYPPENEVLAGVIYGPGGIYEGTYVCPPAQNKQILYIFDD